jgi:hypothetical protein
MMAHTSPELEMNESDGEKLKKVIATHPLRYILFIIASCIRLKKELYNRIVTYISKRHKSIFFATISGTLATHFSHLQPPTNNSLASFFLFVAS